MKVFGGGAAPAAAAAAAAVTAEEHSFKTTHLEFAFWTIHVFVTDRCGCIADVYAFIHALYLDGNNRSDRICFCPGIF
jgi:hypothetical protein